MAANAFRLARLASLSGSIRMVPLDHGVSMGPLPGLEDPSKAVAAAVAGGATCLVVHKGLLAAARAAAGRAGVLLHLSAGTDRQPDPFDKRIVGTVEEAVRAGCDGVSIHVNLGSPTEARQVEEAGRVATACAEWGMPLLAMVYPRGPQVKDPSDPVLVAHAARLGAELGADIVKVPYTGSKDSFRAVVAGCPVPVVVAGGARKDAAALVRELEGARAAGARGVSVGRNVFQDADPAALRRIAQVFP
jgi:predicted phospho-2-dehydro-3-deoxyheptonate aldolase